jgi:hypothetical protein
MSVGHLIPQQVTSSWQPTREMGVGLRALHHEMLQKVCTSSEFVGFLWCSESYLLMRLAFRFYYSVSMELIAITM